MHVDCDSVPSLHRSSPFSAWPREAPPRPVTVRAMSLMGIDVWFYPVLTSLGNHCTIKRGTLDELVGESKTSTYILPPYSHPIFERTKIVKGKNLLGRSLPFRWAFRHRRACRRKVSAGVGTVRSAPEYLTVYHSSLRCNRLAGAEKFLRQFGGRQSKGTVPFRSPPEISGGRWNDPA